MRRRLTVGLGILRGTGMAALLLLLFNPTWSRPAASLAPPLVLLDASLSMAGTNGPWRAALDTARRVVQGGTIWRFWDAVTAFDTGPPVGGASRLAPALAAAAARGGPIVVITDGAIGDTADIPPDLRRRPRIMVLPRPPFFDAFVALVDGPRRVSAADTIELRIAYGTAGSRTGGVGRRATLTISSGGRRLAARDVALPDSGTLATNLAVPAARLGAGWSVLDVRLEGPKDSEPRDDARRIVVEVSPEPSAVVLAAPPDWESRFFAKALTEVARVPVKLFVETEAGRWRDGTTLAVAPAATVNRAVAGAKLIARIGDLRLSAEHASARGGLVAWPTTGAHAGDWYVDPAPASPVAGALTGIAWDSLPPATGLAGVTVDSGSTVVLTARLARRGVARPLVVFRDSAGRRMVTVAGAGLWRWGFRGGASAEAYRSLIAAITDWLLGTNAAGVERVEPVATEAANGTPLGWRWTGPGASRPLAIVLESTRGQRTDTLRFDGAGRAELLLPPAAYRWRLPDGSERGLVVVEEYSDEWRPAAATLTDQRGEPASARIAVSARDQWWLFVVVIAAFAAEWAWRRRQGLP